MEQFESRVQTSDEVEDALTIFRRALAAAPWDRKVTVVSLGHATNLLELLQSPADAESPLTGVQLVEQKVSELIWMGGSYWAREDDGTTEVEWNLYPRHASNTGAALVCALASLATRSLGQPVHPCSRTQHDTHMHAYMGTRWLLAHLAGPSFEPRQWRMRWLWHAER